MTTKFRIELRCDLPEFGKTNEERSQKIADLLFRTAERIKENGLHPDEAIVIRDWNKGGKAIGRAELHP